MLLMLCLIKTLKRAGILVHSLNVPARTFKECSKQSAESVLCLLSYHDTNSSYCNFGDNFGMLTVFQAEEQQAK